MSASTASDRTLDPAALMRKDFDGVARQDLDALVALWSPDLYAEFLAIDTFDGRDAVVAFFDELFGALSNWHFEPGRVLGAGPDTSVGEWRITGTFDRGPFRGLRPTGRPIDMRGVDIMVWEDGLLVHNTVYTDGLAMARQIGLLPADGSAPDRALQSAFNVATRMRTAVRRSG